MFANLARNRALSRWQDWTPERTCVPYIGFVEAAIGDYQVEELRVTHIRFLHYTRILINQTVIILFELC